MTAFSEAEKAADWVMQRHPIQLEAAAKLATDDLAMRNGQDSSIQINTGAEPVSSGAWVVLGNAAQWRGQGMSPMP